MKNIKVKLSLLLTSIFISFGWVATSFDAEARQYRGSVEGGLKKGMRKLIPIGAICLVIPLASAFISLLTSNMQAAKYSFYSFMVASVVLGLMYAILQFAQNLVS